MVWEDILLCSLMIGECVINNSEVMELVDSSLLKGFSGEIDCLHGWGKNVCPEETGECA